MLIELLPEWFGSTQGQQARRRVVSTLDPGRRYRELADQLQVADTIANRAALAEECLALGKFEEALGHYEHILALPMGDDAIYALGKARAQFGFGNPQQAVATLAGTTSAQASEIPPETQFVTTTSEPSWIVTAVMRPAR